MVSNFCGENTILHNICYVLGQLDKKQNAKPIVIIDDGLHRDSERVEL